MGPTKKKVQRTLQTKHRTYDGLFVLQVPILRGLDHEVPSTAERLKRFMDAYLSKAREYAGAVLRKAGLPDTLRQVQKRPDGTWTELPEAFRKDFWNAVENLPDGESIKLTNVATLVYAQEPATVGPEGWESWSFEEIEAYIESLPAPPVDVHAAVNNHKPPPDGQEHRQRGRRVRRAATDKRKPPPEALSPEWLACQVLERADIVRDDLARGDAMMLAVSGIQLSEALNALILTDRYEIPIVVGRAQMRVGDDGGKTGGRPRLATPENIADLQRQADEIWRRTPRKSVYDTAEEIIKRGRGFSLAANTIRRHIKKRPKTPAERRPKNS